MRYGRSLERDAHGHSSRRCGAVRASAGVDCRTLMRSVPAPLHDVGSLTPDRRTATTETEVYSPCPQRPDWLNVVEGFRSSPSPCTAGALHRPQRLRRGGRVHLGPVERSGPRRPAVSGRRAPRRDPGWWARTPEPDHLPRAARCSASKRSPHSDDVSLNGDRVATLMQTPGGLLLMTLRRCGIVSGRGSSWCHPCTDLSGRDAPLSFLTGARP